MAAVALRMGRNSSGRMDEKELMPLPLKGCGSIEVRMTITGTVSGVPVSALPHREPRQQRRARAAHSPKKRV